MPIVALPYSGKETHLHDLAGLARTQSAARPPQSASRRPRWARAIVQTPMPKGDSYRKLHVAPLAPYNNGVETNQEWVERQMTKAPPLTGEQLGRLRRVLSPRNLDVAGVERLRTSLDGAEIDLDIYQDSDDLPTLHDG